MGEVKREEEGGCVRVCVCVCAVYIAVHACMCVVVCGMGTCKASSDITKRASDAAAEGEAQLVQIEDA